MQCHVSVSLCFVNIDAFRVKNPLDEINQLKLLFADAALAAADKLDIIGNVFASYHKSSSSDVLVSIVLVVRSSCVRIARYCLLYIIASLIDGLSFIYSLPVEEIDR